MEIEEVELQNVMSCGMVPGWARISDVTSDFDTVKQIVTLTYSQPRSEHDLTRQTIEEIVW
jgi:hypothetical protein